MSWPLPTWSGKEKDSRERQKGERKKPQLHCAMCPRIKQGHLSACKCIKLEKLVHLNLSLSSCIRSAAYCLIPSLRLPVGATFVPAGAEIPLQLPWFSPPTHQVPQRAEPGRETGASAQFPQTDSVHKECGEAGKAFPKILTDYCALLGTSQPANSQQDAGFSSPSVKPAYIAHPGV